MENPKEVFLLGCNTLAKKEEDNRTASQYLDILLADNIPLSEATRTVEQRYGSVGTSIEDSMKRAFKNVPHIYGFDSVGPSGKNIEHMLNKYHQQNPDYYSHLNEVEIKRALSLMNKFTEWNQQNQSLANVLKVTNFAQTSGLLVTCSGLSGLSVEDPAYEKLKNICLLKSDKLNEEDGIEHILNLLSDENFSLYIPAISDYLDSKPSLSEGLLERIENNSVIKSKIQNLYNSAKTGFGKLDIASFALKLNIISKSEYLDTEKKAMLTYLQPPVSVGSRDAICSYNAKNNINLKKSDLSNKVFSDFNALLALKCLEVKDPEIINAILDVAQSKSSLDNRLGAIYALAVVGPDNIKTLKYLEGNLLNSKISDAEKGLSLMALAETGYISDVMILRLVKMLKSKSVFRINNESMPERVAGLGALSMMQFKTYDQVKTVCKVVGESKKIDYQDYENLVMALEKLPPEERSKFFQDTKFENKTFYNELKKVASQYNVTE
ncbi:hypothetical protein SHI21_15960 [Bacteriovorax sp. PP10]|uniref:HEAT repeat-containing protein n=1 Tax=Bacteriovorax antarcticus TaxID=3088717 RepID=A0ABU5VXF0_9BACT|nr:hypothetical protein [Bacteriovorax sp. PP10]MEA9357726.1 hypothetical protein [Bacteriovorax sp. PP10]